MPMVHSKIFSPSFMKMLGCPETTTDLTFQIKAGGFLKCTATYYTDVLNEVAQVTWTVELCRTSLFYKLINGEI